MRFRSALKAVARKAGLRRTSYVDQVDLDRIAGWAVPSYDANEPAHIGLYIDGHFVMESIANLPRADVMAAHQTPLRCGFEIPLPVRVRDGKSHSIELRFGKDGPQLRKGLVQVQAGSAELAVVESDDDRLIEGVAWFDRGRAVVTGWATGCSEVAVTIGDDAPVIVPLRQQVSGFGGSNRQGFTFALPERVLDGTLYDVQVSAAGKLLDGSPFGVQLGASRPRMAVVSSGLRRIRLVLTQSDGAPYQRAIHVRLNGTPLPKDVTTPNASGEVDIGFDHDHRYLTVTTGLDDITEQNPAYVLGQYSILADGTCRDWSPDVANAALDLLPLAADLADRARDAFDAFIANPDGRFDAMWVAQQNNLGSADDALRYWAENTSHAIVSPGPTFDEHAARMMLPAVDHAITSGAIPCAFALELALGVGTLTAMIDVTARRGGLTDGTWAGTQPDQIIPALTSQTAPTDSIYAAWVSRLSATPNDIVKIEAAEQRSHAMVSGTALTRNPRVSIIMPSWNRAFTIGEAIQSVLDQSYSNWELIICDDASEDRTADVVKGFEDPRIKYMQFQKSNGAGARNHGLRHAQGEYIAYLDSDNIWHPLFLDRMLRQLLGAPGVPIAYSAYLDTEIQGAQVVLQAISEPAFRPVQLSDKNFMDLNSIVHHRRVLDWVGGFDAALPRLQDWDLMLRYTAVFGAVLVDFIGVFYRRNIAWGQVTHTQLGSGAQDTVNLKTQDRLAGSHQSLAIEWPDTSHVTILVTEPSFENTRLAVGLASLASKFSRVELVHAGDLDATGLDAAVAVRPLTHGLDRLDAQLADLADAPLIAVGAAWTILAGIKSVPSDRVFTLTQRADGTWLTPMAESGVSFPLGAVPLPHIPELNFNPQGGGRCLVLGQAETVDGAAWRQALVDHRQDAVLMSAFAGDTWQTAIVDGAKDFDQAATNTPEAISICVVPEDDIADLSPFQFAVLNAAMREGVPVALANSDNPSDLAAQWIAARAAYDLKVPDPDWIFEKIARLSDDPKARGLLSKRGQLVHRIALADELVEGRLAHALWCLQFEPLKVEVRQRDQ